MAFGFSLNTTSLPYLPSYRHALAHYEKIKPLRGSGDPGFRPLGERKNRATWIKQDPATGDIICGLHRTDVLRYRNDAHDKQGTLMVETGGYHTMSTCDFISAVSPIIVQRVHSLIWCTALEAEDAIIESTRRNHKRFPLPHVGPTTFTDAEGIIVRIIHNPVYPVIHKVSRKGANAVRARYADFRKYLSAIIKLRKGDDRRITFGEDALIEMFGSNSYTDRAGKVHTHVNYPPLLKYLNQHQLMDGFLLLCTDAENYPKALAWLAMGGTNPLNAFDRVLMEAFPHEYFTEETITTGQIVRDSYAEYFNR